MNPPNMPPEAMCRKPVVNHRSTSELATLTSLVTDQTIQWRLYSCQASPIAPMRTVGQPAVNPCTVGLLPQNRAAAHAAFIVISTPARRLEGRIAPCWLFETESEILACQPRMKLA